MTFCWKTWGGLKGSTFALIEKIVQAFHTEGKPGKGLPIGSLTSQTFANVYLTPFDNLISPLVANSSYIRYMDDWVVHANSKVWLRELEGLTREFLDTSLRLEWLVQKTMLVPSRVGVPYLGYFLKPYHARVKSRRIVKAFQHLKKQVELFQDDRISATSLVSSWQGWRGHILAVGSPGLLEAGRKILLTAGLEGI